MSQSFLPHNETQRITALHSLNILNTPSEERFDRITRLALRLFNVPIALISLVDTNRQWFKSCQGLGLTETPRSVSFCAYAILEEQILVIPDALKDERFIDNPLVVGEPFIRFYAGCPLSDKKGNRLGTLCLIDRHPRQFSLEDKLALQDLASIAENELASVELNQAMTDRFRVEQELKASEERYRSMIEVLGEGIVLQTFEGSILTSNTSAQQILGLSESQLRDWSRIDPRWKAIHEDGSPFQVKSFPPFITRRTGKPSLNTIMGICKPEVTEFTWVLVNSIPLYNQGKAKPIAILSSFSDITLLKQADAEMRQVLEKEKELGELKTRFVSMTSHEFRTPLTSILFSLDYLETYARTTTEEKRRKHFQRIRTSVNAMTQLLNDVLVIGKLEAERIEFSPSLLDLKLFCQELVEEFQVTSGSHHFLNFGMEGDGLSSDRPLLVEADEKLLRQILGNLLSNAIKYSNQDSRVDLILSKQGSDITFEIKDQGMGVPAEEIPYLFEMFHRGKKVDAIEGTGLGLSIVKKCVDLYGGQIEVKSEEGKGTTFLVKLPASLRKVDG